MVIFGSFERDIIQHEVQYFRNVIIMRSAACEQIITSDMLFSINLYQDQSKHLRTVAHSTTFCVSYWSGINIGKFRGLYEACNSIEPY